MKRSGQTRERRRRLPHRGLALAAAALAVPAVAHALIQRRLRAPEAPGWGRTHRYAGHLGTVAYQELGAGPPVVLLHAFGPGFDAGQWRAAAEALAPHCRVLAPDLPGWGRSATLAPRPELYLASLADFLSGAVWERALLVAAGHAAPYAVRLAAEHPGLVAGVALVAPHGLSLPGGRGHSSQAGAAAHPLVAQLLQVPLLRVSVMDVLTSRAALGHYLRTAAYAAAERVDAALLEHHYRVSHLPAHRRALAAYWRGELDLGAAAALDRLQVPLWIGLSSVDGAHPPSGDGDGDGDGDGLPTGTQVEVIAGTRDLPHAERPLAVGNAIARFLAQLPAA
jgi:pimeloyl-ACP methyl ester carboxylesterase